MRPRHDAAENVLMRSFCVDGRIASMRPRHDAAENREVHADAQVDRPASMRPRHDAAENRAHTFAAAIARACFNEAAA